jgi:uncharacterized protein
VHISSPKIESPWQNPYVWLIILILLWTVISGLSMIVVAYRTHDGVVVDDYYREGRLINRRSDLDRIAADLGLQAQLEWQDNQLTLELKNVSNLNFPAELELTWWHSTRSGFDLVQTLLHQQAGRYTAAFTSPARAGRWNLQLKSEQWRLVGQLDYPAQTAVRLHSNLAVESN